MNEVKDAMGAGAEQALDDLRTAASNLVVFALEAIENFIGNNDAKAEKAQEPRRILDVITLGSETTATECRNCLDKQVSGGWKCKRFDDPLNHAPNRGPWDWILRCPQCLAAEKRHTAMRAMMGGDNASSYD